MNILFIKHFFVGYMVSEIPRVSVIGYFPLYNLPASSIDPLNIIIRSSTRSVFTIKLYLIPVGSLQIPFNF